MPLKRTFFTVLLDDPTTGFPEEFHVEVRASDQLRAELEGKRIPGITLKDGMHTVYLWAWAAMVRLGHFEGTFTAFKDACITAVKDKDKDEEDEDEDVDPTRSAASGTSA